MCGPGADETPHGLRIFQGAWADGYIGRHPVRPGYAYVIWKGRHVAEPTELTAEEAAGFWSEVARVAGAVDEEYRPAKMNWFSLGNGVPHLHVHLVPRPPDDARPGRPVESEAFDFAAIPPAEPAQLAAAAAALRTRLRELT
jgi:diadenosine tetraphosphate (Ap4A) HIT family hydrolase